MTDDLSPATRELLDEQPWYVERGRAWQFEEVVEDAMGIDGQQLVVFSGGKTMWPPELESRTDNLQAEPPEEYVECTECGVRFSSQYHSKFLDETQVCSVGCLREYLDDATEPDRGKGRISNEGTKLY